MVHVSLSSFLHVSMQQKVGMIIHEENVNILLTKKDNHDKLSLFVQWKIYNVLFNMNGTCNNQAALCAPPDLVDRSSSLGHYPSVLCCLCMVLLH